ncbi:Zinc finger CCCH domain-containing protein 6 [Ananas comosus]|uniref:Zinc finger CCCH domain-containing protein 6 n=1 Tax=Ananas comosus TaxID=4615 RepID=A0A199VKP5_ANACO|nr:Zinc finger CCCH domain-containing protein 6 [Ananas comosus]
MELYGRGAAAAAAGGGGGGEGARKEPETGLEESMWRLGLGADSAFPERPGEPDCLFYLRTGSCGYGERCRYNHPPDRGGTLAGAGRMGAAQYPERVGQPLCEYYMKTGTCRFGPMCKYHHPRQGGGSLQPAMLNYYGYPLRPGEKDCSYYMKTGQCKFASSCKYHHPQPSGVSLPSPTTTIYPTVQTPLASWQVGRPSVLPAGSYVSGSYGPVLFSPGVVPVQGWNPYPAPVSSVVSSGGQQVVQAGPVYGLSNQPAVPSYTGSYVPLSPSAGSGGSQREHKSQRPGQPECQFYMRTGDCKYGAGCKYNHPPEWSVKKTNCLLSPLGLPIRPGAQPCTYYAQNGFCKFGPTCKFDHPIGTMSYSPSASSLSEMPIAPFPLGFSLTTLPPTSSSSSEFVKESIPTQKILSKNSSS